MELEQKCVSLFHRTMGLDQGGGGTKTKWEPMLNAGVREMAEELKAMSEGMEANGELKNNPALVRFHLIAEEFAEFLLAEDEVSAFDGLVDLMYVVLGTFDVYDWPAHQGFAEVHLSNMTKAGKDKTRLRDKGVDYQPPDLAGVLRTYRKMLATVGQNHRDLSLQARKKNAELRRNLDKSTSQADNPGR